MTNNLNKQARQALAWNFGGRFAGLIANFSIGIVLARLLLPEEFGLVALVMVNVIIAEVLFELGLGAALIQRKDVQQKHYSSVFVVNVVLGIIVSSLVFLSAQLFSDFYNAPALRPVFEALSCVFLISALTSIHKIHLRRELKQKELNRSNFISIVAGGSVGVCMAWFGFGVWSLVGQKIIYFLINLLACWASSRLRPHLRFSKQAFLELWDFSYKVFLSRFIDVLFRRADMVIAGRLFDLDTVGYYQRARSLNEMSTRAVSLSLLSVMMPVFSRTHPDVPRFQKMVSTSHQIVCLVSFMLFGALYVSTAEIIEIVYTAKWSPAADYLSVLCLSAVAFPINALIVSAVEGSGNGKWVLKMVILKRSVFAINLLVGFSFGIFYFLYGLILVAVSNTTISVFAASRIGAGRITLLLKPVCLHCLVAALAVLCALAIDAKCSLLTSASALLKCVVFVVVYLGGCHVFQFQSLRDVRNQLNLFFLQN